MRLQGGNDYHDPMAFNADSFKRSYFFSFNVMCLRTSFPGSGSKREREPGNKVGPLNLEFPFYNLTRRAKDRFGLVRHFEKKSRDCAERLEVRESRTVDGTRQSSRSAALAKRIAALGTIMLPNELEFT